MDILSLILLPFKLIWVVLSFPFKLIWVVLSFPFKLVLTIVGTVAHGLIATFTAVILFVVSPLVLFSPQHSIDPSVDMSASSSSAQTVMTTNSNSLTVPVTSSSSSSPQTVLTTSSNSSTTPISSALSQSKETNKAIDFTKQEFSLEEKLSIMDEITYNTHHFPIAYETSLNALSQRCTENKEKIGDLAVTGTKILREHGGNVDNYAIIDSIVIQTEGFSNLSCRNEFQTLTGLLLTGLLAK